MVDEKEVKEKAELLIDKISKTKTNGEFLMTMNTR